MDDNIPLSWRLIQVLVTVGVSVAWMLLASSTLARILKRRGSTRSPGVVNGEVFISRSNAQSPLLTALVAGSFVSLFWLAILQLIPGIERPTRVPLWAWGGLTLLTLGIPWELRKAWSPTVMNWVGSETAIMLQVEGSEEATLLLFRDQIGSFFVEEPPRLWFGHFYPRIGYRMADGSEQFISHQDLMWCDHEKFRSAVREHWGPEYVGH